MEFWWNFGFQIYQIFFKKMKNYNFAEFFDKISDLYNKKHKKFKNFFMTM